MFNNFKARYCADPQARKKWLIYGGGATVFVVVLIIIIAVATSGDGTVSPPGALVPSDKGSSVLDEVPLVDGHNDLPYNLYEVYKNDLGKFNFNSDLTKDEVWKDVKKSHTDIPRMKQGKLGGQFWVAYTSCESNYKDAVALTMNQIDVIKRLINKYPNDLKYVTDADGIMQAFSEKKIASLISVEGGHSIDSRMSVLRLYYELGVRYMSLTHNCNLPWADENQIDLGSNTDATKKGLTDWGKELVKEMNRLGMIVDLSHASKKTMDDAITASLAPVIFSHSLSEAIYDGTTRNVDDNTLLKLKENDGIIMVTFNPAFIAAANADMDKVIEHLDHIKTLIGADHIGISADYDGIESTPTKLEDVSKYPDLFDALFEKDWTREELKKLAGLNIIRVLKRVEAVRNELHDKEPYDVVIPDEDLTEAGQLEECRSDYKKPEVVTEPTVPTEEPTTVATTIAEVTTVEVLTEPPGE